MPDHLATTWEANAEDYQTILNEQNPWWDSGLVPHALAQDVERPLAKFLWKRLLVNAVDAGGRDPLLPAR